MRILIYEWVSGGGLLGNEGAIPCSLLREGMAMAGALGDDFARLPDSQVTLLRDVRVMNLSAPGCDLIGVDSPGGRDSLLRHHFAISDGVVLIAPETDHQLLTLTREAEAAGAILLSPPSSFVEAAADKRQALSQLRAAGVPVPEGVVLEPEDPLPADFTYPAVLKPIDGAGSEDTYLVSSSTDSPPPYAWPRLLEPYHAGMIVGVSVLTFAGGAVPLMPFEQRVSSDGQLRYLGGRAPIAKGLAERARELALAAIDAMPPCVGYVGVDMVLGAAPTGADDVVLEVNPRLTTSYIGLRHAAGVNLAQAMVDCRQGNAPEAPFNGRAIEFTTDGMVSFA